MLATISRALNKVTETITHMRAVLAEHGLGGATSPYRADFIHITVSAPEYARLADQLAEARRMIEQGAEREAKLERRVSDLSSSNGALMVDRDRGINAASLKAEGAWQVAEDALAALRDAGIEPGADLATLVEDANRWRHQHEQFLAAERDRLEAFRCTMVGLIHQCRAQSQAGKGLTPELVGKLGRSIDRANNKACGR